jgi:hypothetical protein
MKKITAFVLAVCMLSSVCIVASAAYTPMSVEEMTEALEQKAEDGAKGAMALGWGFDDIKTTTKEYAKDAYAESKTLAGAGKYIFTELSSAEVSALGIVGLEAIAELEKKDGSEKITLYKFTELADAQAYAAVLEEQKGEESDEYVRACGHTVAVGTKSLVYKVGVTVVDNAVVHGDFISTDCEQMESEYYQDLKEGAYSGMQFKTPDSAIIYKNGELVFSAAQKNYYETSGSYAGYQSVDAYMDIYASSFSYDELHEAHAGDSFVLSARLRAAPSS